MLLNIRRRIGFEQITDRIDAKGLQGVLLVGRHKHDADIFILLLEAFRQFKAVHAEHFDVEKR